MTPELAAACERAVHVFTTDGRLLRAGEASLFILRQLGFGPLVAFLSLPPLSWLVEPAYQLIADHRPFFSRFLFRGEAK
jgi:predicted DCC family thiol-disulfide oxidoreductase YuxK